MRTQKLEPRAQISPLPQLRRRGGEEPVAYPHSLAEAALKPSLGVASGRSRPCTAARSVRSPTNPQSALSHCPAQPCASASGGLTSSDAATELGLSALEVAEVAQCSGGLVSETSLGAQEHPGRFVFSVFGLAEVPFRTKECGDGGLGEEVSDQRGACGAAAALLVAAGEYRSHLTNIIYVLSRDYVTRLWLNIFGAVTPSDCWSLSSGI